MKVGQCNLKGLKLQKFMVRSPYPSARQLYVWAAEEGDVKLTLCFSTAAPWACPVGIPSRCAEPRTSRYDSWAML